MAITVHPFGDHNTASPLEQRVIRQATYRLIPFMFVLYIVAYLDRINVGFAALHMNADLGLSHALFGLGSGIFFIGYVLFEIPSNLILHKMGARLWIARIMISWGVISSAMMFVSGPVSFYVLRFLLGLAEAGFFPGMILYLTYWFPDRYLARKVALFMTATPLAGVIGGPVSGALLEMHGFWGISGWQWLFLIEGLPAVVLGIVVFFYLPDRPDRAKWLTPEEKAWLHELLKSEQEQKAHQPERQFLHTVQSSRVWALCLIYFSLVVAMYGVTLWLPLILKEFQGLTDLAIGLITIFPYLAAALFMVGVGLSSDRSGERKIHMACSLALAALGLVSAAYANSLVGKVGCLVIAASGIWGALGPFWAFAGSFLSGTGAAGGIALINSLGNLGGFAGPYLMGLFRDWTGAYNTGLAVLGGVIFLGGMMAMMLKERR